MPVAIKTIAELTTLPITQQSFYDAFKAALVNAGFPSVPYDEFKVLGVLFFRSKK